jgi:hypothetical protein
MSDISQGIRKNLRWRMLEFSMRKYSIEIPIYVVWSYLGSVISQFGKPSFLGGV